MRTLFTIFWVLSFSLLISQNNFTKQAELLLNANRAFDSKTYENSLELYEKAYAINANFRPVDYLKAAAASAEIQKEIDCKNWISKSIIEQKTSKKTISNFSKSPIYLDISEPIINDYDIYLKQFYQQIKNPMLYFQIQELVNRDQATRKMDDFYFGISENDQEKAFEEFIKLQNPADSLLRKKYWTILYPKLEKTHLEFQNKAMVYADSLNAATVLDITKTYGWQEEAFTIIWHQRGSYGKSNWFWDTLKPLIQEEINQGKLPPFFFAVFDDLHALKTEGETIYGYYPGKVNPDTVNKKRKSIGLPSLNDNEVKTRNSSLGGGRIF